MDWCEQRAWTDASHCFAADVSLFVSAAGAFTRPPPGTNVRLDKRVANVFHTQAPWWCCRGPGVPSPSRGPHSTLEGLTYKTTDRRERERERGRVIPLYLPFALISLICPPPSDPLILLCFSLTHFAFLSSFRGFVGDLCTRVHFWGTTPVLVGHNMGWSAGAFPPTAPDPISGGLRVIDTHSF